MSAPTTVLVEALANALAHELRDQALLDPGVVLIAAERARVIDKHPSPRLSLAHDQDEHAEGEMVDAAICYLVGHGADKDRTKYERVPTRWPWDAEDFNPGDTGNADADRLRDLVRAGQLIAAEITRLTTSHAQLPGVS